jgi:predicted house-cleaning NTP pyrophosphatase (Maf/HAM1 superfamily)
MCPRVRFHFRPVFPLSEDEIRDYVPSGEPMGKAGAYGIRDLASRFIDRIEGSYTNVVGLPVSLVYRLLREKCRSPYFCICQETRPLLMAIAVLMAPCCSI